MTIQAFAANLESLIVNVRPKVCRMRRSLLLHEVTDAMLDSLIRDRTEHRP